MNPFVFYPALEQRRQALLQQLAAAYAPDQTVPADQQRIRYYSTWELANTPPFTEPTAGFASIPLEWKRSVPVLIVVAIGFPPFLLNLPIAGGVPQIPAKIFLAGWLLAGLWLLAKLLKQTPRLIIDANGIRYYKWKAAVAWPMVVATYIKQVYINHESSKYFLLVHGYDELTDDFFCREINIGNLAKDEKAIAFLVEYIRQQAGYPAMKPS